MPGNSCSFSLLAVLVLTSLPFNGLEAQQTQNERRAIAEKQIKRIDELRYEYVDGVRPKYGIRYGFVEYDRNGNQTITGRYTQDNMPYAMYQRTYLDTLPVKRIWNCEVNKEYPEGKPCLYFEGYEFDSNGNVAREFGFNMEGDSIAKVIFERDTAGRPLQRWDHSYGSPPSVKHYAYEYNDHGDVQQVLEFSPNGDTLKITNYTYGYGLSGNIWTMNTLNSDNQLTRMTSYLYDDEDNKIAETWSDPKWMPLLFRQFDYTYYD